jgi:ankyrin repeat protein
MKPVRLFVPVAALLLVLAPSAFAQSQKTLDGRLAETISREFPEWKPRDPVHVFQPNMPSSGTPTFFGYWKDGERKLAVYVSLTTSQAELDDDFNAFFRRQIMPASHGVDGIGTRAVLVGTSRSVEIGFAKANLFVTVNYDFPALMNKKVPYYYLPAPKTEAERLTAITRVVADAIDGPRTATACLNDFYDTSPTPPATDTERLLDAAFKGDTASVTSLLAAGVKTDAMDPDGNSPLHLAVINGCPATIQTLIAAKANVNAKNGREETPLAIAAIYADIPTIENLIAAGADLKLKDKFGRNAAFSALSSPTRFYFIMRWVTPADQFATVTYLRDVGIDLNERMSWNGDTLLTDNMYSYGYRLDLVKALVALGVNVNGRASGGQTILIKAVQGGAPSDRNGLVKLLLSLGADVTIKDDSGKTAMDYLLLDQKQRAKSPDEQRHIVETIQLLTNAAKAK